MLKYAYAFVAAAALLTAAPMAHAQYVVPEVTVNLAPPPLRVEVQSANPGAGYMWIAGHWSWRGGQHVWIGGHWAQPPNNGMVWEPARWQARGGQWAFVEGHWRWAQMPTTIYQPPPPPQQPIVVQMAPPAPIMETRPITQISNAVWIPGYWHWNGYSHVWVGGHWSAPRIGWQWQPQHWENTPGGWRLVQGHWRQ